MQTQPETSSLERVSASRSSRFMKYDSHLQIMIPLGITMGLAGIIFYYSHLLLPDEPLYLDALFDILTFMVLLGPILFFLLFRPLLLNIAERKRVEQALRESEANYAAVVEDQSDLICRFKPDGEITFGNRAFYQYFDQQRGHFSPVTLAALNIPSSAGENGHAPLNVDPAHPLFAAECPLADGDGGTHWIAWTIRAIFDQNTIVSYQAVGTDVTAQKEILRTLNRSRDELETRVIERTAELTTANQTLIAEIQAHQQTENMLIERESQLRLFVEQVPAIIWLTDRNLTIMSSLGAGLAEVGLMPNQMVGQNIYEIRGTRDRSHPVIAGHLAALQGQPSRYESTWNDFVLQNYVEPLRDLQGEIVGCIGIALNITASVRAKEQIELQMTALEAAAEGIVITDRNGKIQWCNPAMTQITGYGVEEFIGQRLSVIKSGQQNQAFYQELWETIVSGRPWRGVLVNQRKDGVKYYEDQTITPVKDKKGAVERFVAVKHDITQRKKAELELVHLNWELTALNNISSAIGRSLHIQDIFVTLRETLSKEIPNLGGIILSVDATGQQLKLESAWDFDGTENEAVVPVHLQSTLMRVVEEKKVMFLPAHSLLADGDSHWPGDPTLDCPSLTLTPLLFGETVLGIVGLAFENLENRHVHFFEALGNQVGAAIQNALLYQNEIVSRQTAEVLSSASQALVQTLDLDNVLSLLLKYLGQMVGFDQAEIMLCEEEGSLTRRVLVENDGTAYVDRPHTGRGEVISDSACLNDLIKLGKPVFIADVTNQPPEAGCYINPDARSWLGLPISVIGNTIGVSVLEWREPYQLTAEDQHRIDLLVGQAGVAIQNAWLFNQLGEGRERLQMLSHRLVEVQETERKYIAQELHDEASQALVGLKFGMTLLKQDVDDPKVVIAEVEELENSVSQILDNLHRLAANLRPASLDHLGLIPAIRQFVDVTRDKYGLNAVLTVENFADRPALNVETNLYRIVQESVNNVIRHAQATELAVILRQTPDKIIVVIQDNGRGFDPLVASQGNRLGIFGMRERAEMIGGHIKVTSAIGQGTRVMVEVPYDNSNNNR